MYKLAVTDHWKMNDKELTSTTTKDLGEELDEAMKELKMSIICFESLGKATNTFALEYKVWKE